MRGLYIYSIIFVACWSNKDIPQQIHTFYTNSILVMHEFN